MTYEERPSKIKKENFHRMACTYCLKTTPLLWKYSSQGKDVLICDDCYNKLN